MSGNFLIRVLNCRELKSVGAVSKVTWHLIHKYRPSLHLDDLACPFKSMEGEQSAVLAFDKGGSNEGRSGPVPAFKDPH